MWIDDLVIKHCRDRALTVSIWEPKTPLVVLGSGNQQERECFVDRCQADGVPVFKRYGGGGCVVLHPGCIIVSLGLWVQHLFHNQAYFAALNAALIAALGRQWPLLNQLSQKGLSDLAWAEHKVGGTSLFRSRNYLLYQASLLVQADLDLIERYLPHPSREPDYRCGKSHRHFLGSLSQVVPQLSPAAVAAALWQHLPACLELSMAGEMIPPQAGQWAHLLKKASASEEAAALDALAYFRAHAKEEAHQKAHHKDQQQHLYGDI